MEATVLSPDEPVNKIRSLLAVILRSELKERELVRGLVNDEELRFIDGTEGLGFIGEKYPIGPKQYNAYKRLMDMHYIAEKIMGVDGYFADFRRMIRDEYYARVQRKDTIPRVFSKAVVELLGDEMTKQYRPVEPDRIKNWKEVKQNV